MSGLCSNRFHLMVEEEMQQLEGTPVSYLEQISLMSLLQVPTWFIYQNTYALIICLLGSIFDLPTPNWL